MIDLCLLSQGSRPCRVLRDVLHSVNGAILSVLFISLAFLQSSGTSTASSILLESSEFFTQDKGDINFEAHLLTYSMEQSPS